MDWKKEFKPLFWIVTVFLFVFYMPVGVSRFNNAIFEALELVKWYAREHVLLCLVPAFFIAGDIGVFVSQASVMKYLGARANKILAYGVASVSGTWGFIKQISPLLLLGVLAAGFFLGRAGHEGVIPSEWIAALVGGNSLRANFFASIVGAFMYMATLTEVPILQGLMANGMGKGPALALLLAGPALSLQSIIVLLTIMGWKKR